MNEGQPEQLENKKIDTNEKVRFEYCAKLYDREVERKEKLEKKSEFLLSILVLFLGAIFFKLDFFDDLQKLFVQKQVCTGLIWIVVISLVIQSAAMLTGLIAVLNSMKLKLFMDGNPKKVVYSLFDPDSTYLKNSDELIFFRKTAESYAEAVEKNKEINDEKAKSVELAWCSVIVTTISFSFFLSLYAYIAMFG